MATQQTAQQPAECSPPEHRNTVSNTTFHCSLVLYNLHAEIHYLTNITVSCYSMCHKKMAKLVLINEQKILGYRDFMQTQ